MDLDVPADASYVFDLISPVSRRRELALARDADLVAEFRRALAVLNGIWYQSGKSWRPTDVALAAAADQARAEMSAATNRTLHGIVGKFIHARWAGGLGDHSRLAPYAVLFLKWENAYPQQWRYAGVSGAPWWSKKQVLRRFARVGVPAGVRDDVVRLVVQAIEREHRCEDDGFVALARAVDGSDLRGALRTAEAASDPLVRLHAQYVHWPIDHPTAPLTRAGWRHWLASDLRD